MSSVLKTWTPDDVQAAPDPAKAFCEYAQQTLGVPWPTIKDMTILRKKTKVFFEQYPQCDWRTMCRVVQWCATRKKRHSRVWMVVEEFRKAWTAGALPELNPHTHRDEAVEDRVYKALEEEQDPVWRRRLLLAQGSQDQEEVYQMWVRR